MSCCRLCGANAPLVKAHIIPEAFFRELREDGEAPLLVSGTDGYFPKKAPIGVYDRDMLCGTCEGRFSPVDTYGIDVLLTRFDYFFRPIQNANRAIDFQGDAVDTAKLLEFLVSILWRASVSSHLFYNRVNLGPYESVVKAKLFAIPSVIPFAFDALLSRWDGSENEALPTTALLNPHRERWDGVNAYRLYLGKVIAYVKVDGRSFSEPFSLLSLRAGAPCRLVGRSFSDSKDLRAMRKTVIAAERNRQR